MTDRSSFVLTQYPLWEVDEDGWTKSVEEESSVALVVVDRDSKIRNWQLKQAILVFDEEKVI